MGRYSYASRRAARRIREFNTGTVTLTRTTRAAPEDETPHIPGEVTSTDVYTLDARVDGVTADYVNDTTIVATDLDVLASPKATHTLTNGEAADGAVVDIVPEMTDVLHIDGEPKAIKQITAVPAAGAAVMFHIFVAS
jgi:hypothetical protein